MIFDFLIKMGTVSQESITASVPGAKTKALRPRSKKMELPSFSEQLQSLLRIQEIDTTLSRSLCERQNRPALIEKLRKKIESCQFIIQEKARAHEATEKKLCEAETELKSQQTKRNRAEAKAKRSAPSAEIEALKQSIFGLASTTTALASEKSEIEESLGTTNEELSRAKADLASQERLAEIDKTDGSQSVELQTKQRKRHLSRLSAELLAAYERTRKTKGGVGVVALRKQHCSGCNMLVPAQVCVEVRRAKVLMTCPNCQRMLCWCSAEER